MTEQIIESTRIAPQPSGNRWRARIIEGNIWGSSGYYPAEVLERDGAATWPQGTAVFFDHPGETERHDRPERSVRDLAGRIASTPAYEGDGLYAEIEFYSHAAPIVKEMAGDIGLSIRASASIENGEAGGRTGPVVTALHEGLSVDLVTRAGAGGRLVSLMESARPLLVIDEAPARREVPADDPTNLPDVTAYTPAAESAPNVPAPAGRPTPTPQSQEDTMGTIQVDEAEHGRLTEAAGRVTALESERAQAIAERDEAREALAVERRTAAAARIVDESNTGFTALERRGLLAELPVTAEGALDVDAFTATVTEAAAAVAEANGAGRPRGFGATTHTDATAIVAEAEKAAAAAFGRQSKEG